MGRYKFTHNQLIVAHKRQTKALTAERALTKSWKERATNAENKLRQYVLVDDKPDYFLSMTGFSLFRRYYRSYGLIASQMEVLMMVSYVEIFFATDYVIFKSSMLGVQKRLDSLVEMRYIIRVTFAKVGHGNRKKGYVLTQRGKDMISDYKKYYDEKMEEIRNKRVGQLTFEDGAYFKRTKLNKYYRRLLQGGGMLPMTTFNAKFIDNDIHTD